MNKIKDDVSVFYYERINFSGDISGRTGVVEGNSIVTPVKFGLYDWSRPLLGQLQELHTGNTLNAHFIHKGSNYREPVPECPLHAVILEPEKSTEWVMVRRTVYLNDTKIHPLCHTFTPELSIDQFNEVYPNAIFQNKESEKLFKNG